MWTEFVRHGLNDPILRGTYQTLKKSCNTNFGQKKLNSFPQYIEPNNLVKNCFDESMCLDASEESRTRGHSSVKGEYRYFKVESWEVYIYL